RAAESPALSVSPVRAVILIRLVRRTLDFEVLHHPPLRLQQPLRTRTDDRLRFPAAMLIELVASLTQPALAALSASHDDIRVKLDLRRGHLYLADSLALRVFASCTLARELLFRRPQRSPTTLTRAQMLRQLVPARIAI